MPPVVQAMSVSLQNSHAEAVSSVALFGERASKEVIKVK